MAPQPETGGGSFGGDFADSQTLSVAVDGETFELLSYQVINNEVLEIDDSLPVWQGEMEAVNP